MRVEKFGGINGTEIQNQYKNEIGKKKRAGETKGQTVQNEEAVSLKEGTEIEAKVKAEKFTEEISKEKVEKIKSAIESGDYSVNVHKIADSMIKEILGL